MDRSIPHVKGCRCEGCLEGRYEQHPAGCLCAPCQDRDAAGNGIASLLRGVGKRVEKAVHAVEAAKDVLTPREREALLRFVRSKL